MGEVVSIGDWLRDRGLHAAGRSDDVARLERAVSALEPLLEEVSDRRRPTTASDVETELLAATGAVSLELFDEAADRLERLAHRLNTLARRGG
jgi:hypothetical protein